jgi:hypothetical protein
MSTFKASKITDTAGVVRGTPVNIVTISIPKSTAAQTTGYVNERSEFTTSNTARLYTFDYQPIEKESFIVWQAMIEVDASSNNNNEHLVIFVNGVPLSNAYFYRRNNGNEPMSKSQSGVYINTSGGVVNFDIRGCSGVGGSMFIGETFDSGNNLSNTITIFEVQK